MARIKRYLVNGAEGARVERYLVLFRHAGREKPARTFDDFEAALAEKQRADRAKREGKLDDYAAGLLTEPDSRMTLWDFMRLWFREDAAPHLAEATLTNYLQVANKWIRPIAGTWPLRAFEKPGPVNQLLSHAQREGVPRFAPDGALTTKLDYAGTPTVDRIRKIISSALTWGVEHRGDLISANGCKQVMTRRHRRSGRARVTSPASRPERALTAEAAERIARALLARSRGRTWEPYRDALLLRCEFGLGLRPEEMTAARWGSLARPTHRGDWILVIDAALSHGHVTGVKTTERSKRVPPIVYGWLTEGGKSHWHMGSRLAPRTSSFLEPPRAVISRSTSTRSGAAATSGLPRRSWRVSIRTWRTSQAPHPTRRGVDTSRPESSPASLFR